MQETDETLMPVTVRRAEWAAEGIMLFELAHPAGAALPEFAAGAHLRVRVPNGQIRRYSLCNDPSERHRYLIAVKREYPGRGGSVSLVDGVHAGDTLPVSAPRNDFSLTGNPASYLFIAGGIGITPILSMLRQALSDGKPFRLIYLTRSPEHTAFRSELADPALHGRMVLHHDGGDPARAFDLWPLLAKQRGQSLYCCGPRGLMQAVRDMTGHWPNSAVHFEDFGANPKLHAVENHPFLIRLARSGAVLEVSADRSILEVLRAAGHRVPSSCESGTCGSSRTGLRAGIAEHRDLVLTEAEQDGAIMVCVSRARDGELELDL